MTPLQLAWGLILKDLIYAGIAIVILVGVGIIYALSSASERYFKREKK